MYLEHSLKAKGQFQQFIDVMEKYLELNHAELVPSKDLCMPNESVFYQSVDVVSKDSNTAMKLCAVFNASAKSTLSGSLNDELLLKGPIFHSSLVDVLLHFRIHRIALATDINMMYHAILLHPHDCDLHRFM